VNTKFLPKSSKNAHKISIARKKFNIQLKKQKEKKHYHFIRRLTYERNQINRKLFSQRR